MTVSLSPLFNATQLFDNNGQMLAGGILAFYQAGSFTVLSPIYTDVTGSTPRANPILLSSTGRVTGEVWIDSILSYNVVLYQPDGVTIIQNWDNVSTNSVAGVSNITGILPGTGISVTGNATVTISSTVAEWLVETAVPTFVSGVQFTLPGNLVSTYKIGRRIKATITAGTVYGTIVSSAYTSLTTINLVMDTGMALDSGLSAISYGFSNYLSQPGGAGKNPITLTSAATTPIGAAPTTNVFLTGTTSITAFDNVNAGTLRYVTFNSALAINYNATSMILLGGNNRVYQVGDTSLFLSLGNGNWKELIFNSFSSGSSVITSVRQGIVYCPTDTDGEPCFLQAGGTAGLSLTTQNIVSSSVLSSIVSTPIASPGITTWVGHGLSANQPIVYSTTGALPTGLVAGTTYYVLAAGLGTDVFEVSATPGGAAINFTGTTSGVSSCATIVQNEITAVVTTPIASPGVVNWTAHPLLINQAVQFSVSAGGALPTGITAATTYYVSATGYGANSFEISATPGGTPINFTGSTSGTVTCLAGYRSNLLVSAYAPTTTTGDNNIVGSSSSNLTWTGLQNNYTNYLYVLISANGTLTTGSTIIPPSIVNGATNPGTLAGQITIDNVYNNVWIGNGTVAVKTALVVLATAVASGGVITSTNTYDVKQSALPAGTLIKKTIITTSGTFVPDNLTKTLNCVLVGGGGNGANNVAGGYYAGAAGGSAGYVVDGIIDLDQTTKAAQVTTAIATPGVVGWQNHRLQVNQPIQFYTSGTLPTGLTGGTTYYVISSGFGPNSFEVSATLGGAAINFTGSTTGLSYCFSVQQIIATVATTGSGGTTSFFNLSAPGGASGTPLAWSGAADYASGSHPGGGAGSGAGGSLGGGSGEHGKGATGGAGGNGSVTPTFGGGGGGGIPSYYIQGQAGNGGAGATSSGTPGGTGGTSTAYGGGGGGAGGGITQSYGGSGGPGVIVVWEYA